MYFSIYSSAGEKIKLEIDEKKLKSGKNLAEALTVSGNSSAITKNIIHFKSLLRQESFKNKPDWSDKQQPDKKFATVRIARLQEELNFLDKYIRENKIEGKVFRKWAKNDLTYKAGFDIALFPFAGKLNTSLTDQELMQLLEEVPVNNTMALNNSSYYNFLRVLSSDMMIIININKTYEEIRKQNGLNPVPVYLNKLDQYATGIAKQIMYYDIYAANEREQTEYYIQQHHFK